MLGILAVTSEWGQRTALVTFTLEPHRGRIVIAKLVATVVLGAVAVVVALGLAAARQRGRLPRPSVATAAGRSASRVSATSSRSS